MNKTGKQEDLSMSPADKPSTFMHFTVENELLDAIEDFRFKHRFDRRSTTIKWLLNWALERGPEPDQNAKLVRSRAKRTAKKA